MPVLGVSEGDSLQLQYSERFRPPRDLCLINTNSKSLERFLPSALLQDGPGTPSQITSPTEGPKTKVEGEK